MKLEDLVLDELYRAAERARRPHVAVLSSDLDRIPWPTGNRETTRKAIQRMIAAGRVVRVRRGLLVLPDRITGMASADMVDIVDAIASPPYLITGGRALEHHKLTDQHFSRVIVLATGRPDRLVYRGSSATFVRTDPVRVWRRPGSQRPHYAAPERTIVDVLHHPHYEVSLAQAVDALVLAVSMDPAFLDRLLEAVVRYDSPSAARRVGLVVEHLYGPDPAAPYRKLIGGSYDPVLLRARSSPVTGPLDTTWRVVVNATLPGTPAS